MAGRDIIMATQEELKRLHIIHKCIEKSISQEDAGELIGVCTRQVQRVVRRVRIEGDKGVIHRSRGKLSNRVLPSKLKRRALELYQEKYHDFGPTFASEKLFEIHKIKINDETLRLWLIERNIAYKKRKKRPHRQWRQRKAYFGEMIQVDGSHHDWFEGRGHECVFMGYIDDATGRPFGRFYPYEGTMPAMESFRCYIDEYGIPVSVYLDKHTTYKSTKEPSIEDQLNNVEPLSQVARVFKELSVNVIHADSPQAKGRVERLFRTLQDRLIKEMRLKDIRTIENANKFLEYYLPIYSNRFAVKPVKDTNLHRPLPEGINLDKIFCIKTKRTLRNDFTVAHNGKLYQIEDNLRVKDVMVEERMDGSVFITHKDTNLRYKEITTRPKKEQKETSMPVAKEVYILPKDHPWRKFKLPGSPDFKEKEEILVGAL